MRGSDPRSTGGGGDSDDNDDSGSGSFSEIGRSLARPVILPLGSDFIWICGSGLADRSRKSKTDSRGSRGALNRSRFSGSSLIIRSTVSSLSLSLDLLRFWLLISLSRSSSLTRTFSLCVPDLTCWNGRSRSLEFRAQTVLTAATVFDHSPIHSSSNRYSRRNIFLQSPPQL